MDNVLKGIEGIIADCCITISFNTHRTMPDNDIDSMVLRNLVNATKKRLQSEYKNSTPLVAKLSYNLDKLADSIDHRMNLESLILFVNEDITTYTRLAVGVKNSIVIGDRFVIRDVMRAQYSSSHYYILLLSMREVRLIEAFDRRPLRELSAPFPIINSELHSNETRGQQANALRQTHLQQEFLNKADKLLIEAVKDNKLPIVVCAEESTYHQYMKVADNKEMFVGHFNFDISVANSRDIHITEAAWPTVKAYNEKKNSARIAEFKRAINGQNYLVDINEIWKAVKQGRGHTLFVKNDFFLPVVVNNDLLTPVSHEEREKNGVIDDIISLIIVENLRHGGEVAFMEGDVLEKYADLALTLKSKK